MDSRARGADGRKLVVIGQGYVGLPISMRAVEIGYDVVGIDLEQWRVDQLTAGVSYIEDVSNDVLQNAIRSRRYRAETTYDRAKDFDYAVITVPTPLREGLPDLSHIEQAAAALAHAITVSSTVILESTTYPGTTEELLVPILEEGSGLKAGTDFYVGYSPERLDPGNATFGLVNTPKVVAGIDDVSLRRVEQFYRSLVDDVVVVSDCKVAEFSKLLENTFRHVNIALVNELAMFAQGLGVNIREVIDASSTKPFGFMRFMPGPGVGGHCLPVDPSYLSWQVKRTLGVPFRFVELANDVNDHMPDYVLRRIIEVLNKSSKPVRGSTVLLLGLAYKKNTADIRESPSVRVAEMLGELGAVVRYCDSHVDEGRLKLTNLPRAQAVALTEQEVGRADLVVVLTDHDAVDYPLVAAAGAVLDCRHRLPAAANIHTL